MKTVLEVIDAVGSFASGMIAIIILVELLHYRRGERQTAQRAQAEQVTMSARTLTTPLGNGSFSIDGGELTIFNESAQVIHLDRHVTIVQDLGWDLARHEHDGKLPTLVIELTDLALRPGKETTVQIPAGWIFTSGVGGVFAIVRFVDARGVAWLRRTDTFELAEASPPITRPQEWFQRLTYRVRPLGWLLVRVPMRAAVAAARRRPESDRLPLAARWVCFVHGYWPAGRGGDSWYRPNGAPAVWGYEGLDPRTLP